MGFKRRKSMISQNSHRFDKLKRMAKGVGCDCKGCNAKEYCPLDNDSIKNARNLWFREKEGVEYIYGRIECWDTSQVTDMNNMFGYSSFNQDLSCWDTSKVTNMNDMFNNAKEFDQDLSCWDTSRVKYMSHMFEDAEKFNQNFCWDLPKGANTWEMFVNSPGCIKSDCCSD